MFEPRGSRRAGGERAPAEGGSHEARPELIRLASRVDIAATSEGIARVRFGQGRAEASTAKARALIAQARAELAQYLAGTRSDFTVPLDLSGLGDFQRAVLAVTGEIPFGEIRSYRWIAKRVGNPRAVRAVGAALSGNPVPLLIPCHRVVRSDGGPGGYIFGLPIKDQLLEFERGMIGLYRRSSAATRASRRRNR